MSKEIESSILQFYEPKKLLGSGAYGHVWRVLDRESRKELALKKIFDAFHNDVDAQRTYRQISVLHELDHYNIIKLHRVLKAKNNRDLYLVFDYMESDLQSVIGIEVLEDVHIRFVIFQLLRALKYLHSAQLIHRDLKPSNILINSQCEVKICDFGLVRSLTCEEDQEMVLSEEVATRWYRSPQMLLGSKKYGKETDVWSLGCVVAQLIMCEPIFPGDSTLNQLEKILQFTGIPSKQSIDSIESESAENLINQIKQLSTNRKSFHQYFKKANKDIVTLISRMLEFDPRKRITIEEMLELDMFDEYRKGKLEADVCTKFIVPQLDDNLRFSLQCYRKAIYCDIERRYPEVQMHNNDSMERSFNKQNKRLIRSHHSLNRKKSSEHFKALNSSVSTSHYGKKEPSASFHQGQNLEKIRKMKKQWKKESMPCSLYSQTTAEEKHVLTAQPTNVSGHYNKAENYYKGKGVLVRKESNALLTKVRSRKILCKSKSKEKLQPSRPALQKRRLIR